MRKYFYVLVLFFFKSEVWVDWKTEEGGGGSVRSQGGEEETNEN